MSHIFFNSITLFSFLLFSIPYYIVAQLITHCGYPNLTPIGLYTVLYIICGVYGGWREDQNDKKGVPSSQNRKIARLKLALGGLLICQVSQQLVVHYLFFYINCEDEKKTVLIGQYIICGIGLLSILPQYLIRCYSRGLFHRSDFLDIYSIIPIFIIYLKVGQWGLVDNLSIILLYTPWHFFTIKTLLVLYITPSGVIFIDDKGKERYYVVVKTWTGKTYKGYISNWGDAIRLKDVEEIKDGIEIQICDGTFYVFAWNIKSLKMSYPSSIIPI